MHDEEVQRTTDSGQTSKMEYVDSTTPDSESLRYATGSVPQQCVDEGEGSHPPFNSNSQDTKFLFLHVHSEELHMPEVCEQQSDDNVESDHLVGGELTCYICTLIHFLLS